jgi:hypothetical protein
MMSDPIVQTRPGGRTGSAKPALCNDRPGLRQPRLDVKNANYFNRLFSLNETGHRTMVRPSQAVEAIMLREKFNEALKDAMRAKDATAVSTVRLILARLKELDIEARAKGNKDGIPDADILVMFGTMIKQRNESIAAFKQGGRQELADKEQAEIEVIRRFMPQQLDAAGVEDAVRKGMAATGATSVKQMGPLMAWLKANYAGQMDFSQVAGTVKKALGG